MAKINKSAVMQKLIDELELYPAADTIPTELAEKIVPTFQVNSEEIIVSPPVANVVRTASVTGTIYTVPSTGKFYLTNVYIGNLRYSAAGTANSHITITPKGSSSVTLIRVWCNFDTAVAGFPGSSGSLNFQNPIELEPGSTIDFTSLTADDAIATIVGYTEED